MVGVKDVSSDRCKTNAIIRLREYIATVEENNKKALKWLEMLEEGEDTMQGSCNKGDRMEGSKRKRSEELRDDGPHSQRSREKRGRVENTSHGIEK